jgi:hypothetical protein
VTVADLMAKGATALDDAAVKALIVGKTLTIRNAPTGQTFEVIFSDNGRRLITSIDGTQPEPGEVGDVMHGGELGSPAAYSIEGGKIVTSLGNDAFDVTVYKAGDKYYGARSNEFGYANYEIVSK